MTKANDPCSGGAVLFFLKNEKSHSGKIALIEEAMEGCAKARLKVANKSGKGKKGKGSKRKMSWYNACIKINGKEAMSNGKCKRANLNDSELSGYQKKADEFNREANKSVDE